MYITDFYSSNRIPCTVRKSWLEILQQELQTLIMDVDFVSHQDLELLLFGAAIGGIAAVVMLAIAGVLILFHNTSAAKETVSELSFIGYPLLVLVLSCTVAYFNFDFYFEYTFTIILQSINYTFPPFEPAVIRNPQFEWTRIVREHREEILEELQRFLFTHQSKMNDLQMDTLFPDQDYLNQDGGWRAIYLRCYGTKESEIVRSEFPKTMELLDRVHSITTIPLAYISILDPHKSLPPHRGIFGGVLRYHLTLSVPVHSVDDLHLELWPDAHPGTREWLEWSNGSDFIFDDRNLHSVVNRMNQTRIILLLEFPRPDLSFWHDLFNKVVINIVPRMTARCPNGMQMQNRLLAM